MWRVPLWVIGINISGPNPLTSALLALLLHYDPVKIDFLTSLSPLQCVGVLLPALASIVYWANGLILLYIDSMSRPDVIQQFKIQQTKSFDTQKIYSLARNIVVGQVAVVFPACLALGYATQRGLGVRVSDVIPSAKEITLHFSIFIVFEEVLFYYGHVLLHSRALYGPIHKIHHEYTSPIGLAAAYCHPLEMLLSNVLPLLAGAFCLGSHIYTLILWTVLVVLGTQNHHCGYRWPWQWWFDLQPNFHDFHHERFTGNYGILGWLDRFHGTDLQWRQRVALLQQQNGCGNYLRPSTAHKHAVLAQEERSNKGL